MKKSNFLFIFLFASSLFATDKFVLNAIDQLNNVQGQVQAAGTIATNPADCSTCAKKNPLDSLSFAACNEGKNTYLNQKLQTPYRHASSF